MPMAVRTPLMLAQLSYGVIPTSEPKFYRPFDYAGPSDPVSSDFGRTQAQANLPRSIQIAVRLVF